MQNIFLHGSWKGFNIPSAQKTQAEKETIAMQNNFQK